MTQQQLLEALARSESFSRDFALRNALIANPKTILHQTFPSLALGENVRAHLHEDTAQEMHIIMVAGEDLVFSDALETAVEQVLDKAVGEPDLRKRLMADPKGTLATLLPDFYVPEDFRIYFHENSTEEIHLLLPPLAQAEDELSEAELDAVAGGSRGRGPHIGRKRGGKAPHCRSQKFRR
ncbi:MAG: hypothetical protein HC913_05650 [Microscillaceae bacterium]|nr:hypothetical protein [Microscillaceae bacterium]